MCKFNPITFMNLVNYPKDEGHKVLNQANDKEKGYELFVP
jgi:hypothetical protein